MKSFIKTLDSIVCAVGGATIYLFTMVFSPRTTVPILFVVLTLIGCFLYYSQQPINSSSQVIDLTPDVSTVHDLTDYGSPSLWEMINGDKIKKTIYQQAVYVGVDPEYMLILASMESSLRVGVKSSATGAMGLFQFTKVTWNYLKKRYGSSYDIPKTASRDNAGYNARMAAVYVKHIKDVLQEKGVDFSYSFAYIGHFLGPTNMVKFIRANPMDSAVNLFSEAAEHNPVVFYDNGKARTVTEVLDFINKRIAFNRSIILDS